MTRTSPRLAAILGSGLLLVACGNANGSAKTHAKSVPTPWSQIARANASTLLIDTDQSTADRSSRCFVHYTARVVAQTSRRISIELLAPAPRAQAFRCAANAVRGPFLVPVHLAGPYRGQRLLDARTGRTHRLTRRGQLT